MQQPQQQHKLILIKKCPSLYLYNYRNSRCAVYPFHIRNIQIILV